VSKDKRQRSLEEIGLDGLAQVPLRRTPPDEALARGLEADDPPAPEKRPRASASSPSARLEAEAQRPAPLLGFAGHEAPQDLDEDEVFIEWSGLEPAGPARARFGDRILAALADGVVYLGVLASAIIAMTSLGLEPELALWPGLAALLLSFSFLYVTLPLAFWGQTAGMAWRGLRLRDAGGPALSFGQAAGHWLSGWATVLLAGLPLLLALGGGRSGSERINGTRLHPTNVESLAGGPHS
jgi:uncharacterized RDD family membrane protein YckC